MSSNTGITKRPNTGITTRSSISSNTKPSGQIQRSAQSAFLRTHGTDMTLKRIARGTRRKIDVVLGRLQKLATDNMRVCQNPEGSTTKSTNQGAKNQSVAAGENQDPVTPS